MHNYKTKLLIFLIFTSSFLYSQSINETKIDSLKTLLTSASEEDQAKIYTDISNLYTRIDANKSLEYAKTAITLSKKIESDEKLGYSFIAASIAYRYLNNVDSSMAWIDKAIELFEKTNNQVGIAKASSTKGVVLYNEGNFTKAIKEYEKTLKIAEAINDSSILSKAVQNMANSYWYLGNYDLSLENYLRSLKINEKLDDKNDLAASLNNLALFYDLRGNVKEGLKYYERALEIKLELGNKASSALTLMNISQAYLTLKDYEKSEEAILKSIQLIKESGNTGYFAGAYSVLSNLNQDKGNIAEAIKNMKLAIEYSRKGKSNWRLGSSLFSLGKLYQGNKNYELAEKSFNESLTLARESDALGLMKNNYKSLSEIYLQRRGYKKASVFLQDYIEVNDSLFNQNKEETIQEMQTKYETEKKEQEIELLNKEKALADVSLENEKLLRNSFIGGTFTFLVIAIGLFNRYRFKSKTNNQLSSLNSQLSELNDQLEDELTQAASYIQSLLPPKISDKIRTDWIFVPSSQLGGDSFGYYWLNDHQFSFYLIDVSGHGVGAALLSTAILNSLRSRTLTGADFTDPSSVLNSLNKSFDMEEHEGKYFAIWYGVIDIITNELTCASAMHPPAICIGKKGITSLGKKDIMIGAFPDYDYENVYYKLNGGDRLFLFSDGCFEIENDDEQVIDFEKFTSILEKNAELDQPLNIIFDELSKMNSNNSFNDDYSMLELELLN